MASNIAKAAHRGDGGDLRKQSGRADGSENRRSSDQTQLILTPRPAAQSLPDLQARWLTRRFLLSAPLAAAIASLVFGEVRT